MEKRKPFYNLSQASGSTSGTLLNISRNVSWLPRFARFSKYSSAERAATFSATASRIN
jgi:hypothetical protein